MTKFILRGGNAQHINEKNDEFFREIIKDVDDPIDVLLIHFASDPKKADENKEKDIAQFERIKGNKVLNYFIARQDNFENQIDKSDIIYFGGGTTDRLKEELAKFPELANDLVGKIVAGESAGANIFCKYCFSKSGGGVINGLGIVPIKIICHFEGKYFDEMEAIPDKLPIVFLKNYEFKVYEM